MGLCISVYIAVIPLCLLVAAPTAQCRAQGFPDFTDYDGSSDEWEWSQDRCQLLWADHYDRQVQLSTAFANAHSKYSCLLMIDKTYNI